MQDNAAARWAPEAPQRVGLIPTCVKSATERPLSLSSCSLKCQYGRRLCRCTLWSPRAADVQLDTAALNYVLLVYHSARPLLGLGVVLTLRLRGARSIQPAILSFSTCPTQTTTHGTTLTLTELIIQSYGFLRDLSSKAEPSATGCVLIRLHASRLQNGDRPRGLIPRDSQFASGPSAAPFLTHDARHKRSHASALLTRVKEILISVYTKY